MKQRLLDLDEERRLVALAQGSNARAADKAMTALLEAYQPQISRLARKALPHGLELSDAEQLVRMAAVHAIRTLDVSRGRVAGRLKTKAEAVLADAKVAVPTVRTSHGSKARKRQAAWLRMRDAFRETYGRDPDQEESNRIFRSLGIDEGEALAYLAVRRSVRIDHNEMADAILDAAEGSEERSTHADAVQRQFDHTRLREVISLVRFHRTDPLDRIVLDHLLDDPPMSDPALAATYDVPLKDLRKARHAVMLDLREEMTVGMPKPQPQRLATTKGPIQEAPLTFVRVEPLPPGPIEQPKFFPQIFVPGLVFKRPARTAGAKKTEKTVQIWTFPQQTLFPQIFLQ